MRSAEIYIFVKSSNVISGCLVDTSVYAKVIQAAAAQMCFSYFFRQGGVSTLCRWVELSPSQGCAELTRKEFKRAQMAAGATGRLGLASRSNI